jgi:hypothetical protein
MTKMAMFCNRRWEAIARLRALWATEGCARGAKAENTLWKARQKALAGFCRDFNPDPDKVMVEL